ncbi:MAG: arginase [Vulcanimicrobiota bacterium]
MSNKLGIIGVPLDLGGNRRGVDMGPFAVRHAGLISRLRKLGYEVRDFGNLEVPGRDELEFGDPSMRYLPEIAQVCQRLCDRVQEVLELGYRPLTIGGDHSCAIGSVAGVARFRQGKPFGLLWVDAHGDLNLPETSPSGNIHGMPVSVLLGRGPDVLTRLGGEAPKVQVADLVHIGIRELDPHEVARLAGGEHCYYSMLEIDAYGIHEVTRAALKRVSRNFTMPVHFSFDLDVVDPDVAPGVGSPVPGGLTYREAHLMMELIAEARLQDGSPLIHSMDVVEVNPILDQRNRTADMAVGLTVSALEKRHLPLQPL